MKKEKKNEKNEKDLLLLLQIPAKHYKTVKRILDKKNYKSDKGK